MRWVVLAAMGRAAFGTVCRSRLPRRSWSHLALCHAARRRLSGLTLATHGGDVGSSLELAERGRCRWYSRARARGISIGRKPAVGAIAWWSGAPTVARAEVGTERAQAPSLATDQCRTGTSTAGLLVTDPAHRRRSGIPPTSPSASGYAFRVGDFNADSFSDFVVARGGGQWAVKSGRSSYGDIAQGVQLGGREP